MKRIKSYQLGIDQGSVDLFSDFATNGEMWTGSGSRERRKLIAFSEPFIEPPAVQVALSLWDMDTRANMRADLLAENVTETGFDMVFRTWADTRIARVRISWLAMGSLTSADDWDIENI